MPFLIFDGWDCGLGWAEPSSLGSNSAGIYNVFHTNVPLNFPVVLHIVLQPQQRRRRSKPHLERATAAAAASFLKDTGWLYKVTFHAQQKSAVFHVLDPPGISLCRFQIIKLLKSTPSLWLCGCRGSPLPPLSPSSVVPLRLRMRPWSKPPRIRR